MKEKNNRGLYTFSLTRNTAPKKSCSRFLALPAELRNLVYDFYFQVGFFVELVAQGTNLDARRRKTIKLCLSSVAGDGKLYKKEGFQGKSATDLKPTLRMSRLLGSYSRVNEIDTNWAKSYSPILLICKQIYSEVIVMLYANTTFIFNASNRLSNFLAMVPKPNLAWVKKLRLHYSTYGNPNQTSLATFKTKHCTSWTKTCTKASKLFSSLQELRITLHVTDTPLHFDLRQTWLLPILQFRRLTRPRISRPGITTPGPLKDIQIDLSTFYTRPFIWYNSQLEEACKDLHALFADAIRKRVLGIGEEDALSEYKKAWEGKYEEWQHHLHFCAMV